MNIAVLGTGMVGNTIATALIEKGHQVMMGSRSANNEKAEEWVKKSGEKASQGSFDDAAAFGEILFLALNGAHALDAVRSIQPAHTANKIVIDITNPLDFSQGMPPRLIEGLHNSTSLGEEIQKVLSNAYVVKTLNTVNCNVMVNPGIVNNGDHHLYLCGDNPDAKAKVKDFLATNFHWKPDHLLELGGIQSARCVEAFVPFWVVVMQTLKTPMFNFKLVQ